MRHPLHSAVGNDIGGVWVLLQPSGHKARNPRIILNEE